MGAGRSQPIIVEHYRLDVSARLRGALLLAAAIVTLGALLLAAAFYARNDPMRVYASPNDAIFRAGRVRADGSAIDSRPLAAELALGVFGFACIVSGGGIAIVRLRRVLKEEVYLVLRSDGALFRRGEEDTFVPWDEVEEVRWDDGAVRFVRHDGSAWVRDERYASIEGAELAQRAAEVRRKALFGTLGA